MDIITAIKDLPPIPLEDLTTVKVDGTGAFDVLMSAVREHLELEFKAQRIKGSDYTTVYLTGLQQTLQTAVEFLVQGRKGQLEALLAAQQIALAEVEVEKAKVELEILEANQAKIPYEIQLLQAQVELTQQQAANAEKQLLVLDAQICKLKAEYDLVMAQIEKAAQEGELIAAKVATEKAQTLSMGVDEDSVIGRQKILYKAQADGFARDAEQKVAKTMIDTWNVRRTTDEATDGNAQNRLMDSYIGQAVAKMLAGVQIT